MKKLARNATLLLLAIVMESGMLAAPLANTVYAGEKPAAIHDADKDHRPELKDQHGRDQQLGKDEHHDWDKDRNPRDDRDQGHDKDWRDGGRDNHYRWDRLAFRRHVDMYREWLLANRAAVINQNPVTVVMSAANVLGFDVNTDTFTLMSQNAYQAVVQVFHAGETFSITLNNANGVWTVAEMTQLQ